MIFSRTLIPSFSCHKNVTEELVKIISIRFGEISLNSHNTVLTFNEKPQVKNDWINGGFFIFNKGIFK